MSKRIRKFLMFAVKVAFAALLLWWVLGDLPWQQFFQTVRNARRGLLLCAAGGYIASLVVIAIRWWWLLRTQEIHIRLWEVIRLTFLGQFFNAVLPSTIGGDAVKAFYAAKHTPHKGAALVTVFVDRLMGMTELAVLAGAMTIIILLSGHADFHDPEMKKVILAVAVALGAVGMMLVFLLSSRVRKLLHLQKIYRRLPIGQHIESARAAAVRFRSRPGSLGVAILITLVAHAVWISSVMLIGQSLSLQLPWFKYFIYIPLIYIIGAIPLTPGGVGLVEALYKVFFVAAATGDPEVIALALLARLMDIIRGLPGALVLMTGTKVPPAEAMEAELADETDQPTP